MSRLDRIVFVKLLVVCCATATIMSGRVVVDTLSVTNGGIWGTWGDAQFCPKGSYAVGYTMKIEPDQEGADDTSLNAIKLLCSRREEYDRAAGAVTSGQGNWGIWYPNYTCSGKDNFLVAFKLRVESYQESGDDTAANYIYFKCREFHGFGSTTYLEQGTGFWGDWGQWSYSCPDNSAICGLTTRVESRQGDGDDTALNDVQFYCCKD